MNSYIDAQCKHMVALVSTFEQACELAAIEDDGQVSPEEKRTLKKIKASAQKFKIELDKLNK